MARWIDLDELKLHQLMHPRSSSTWKIAGSVFFFSPAPDTEVHGNPKVVQALCLARADGRLRSQSSRGGNNAMDLARQHGHTEVMKILGGSSYHVGGFDKWGYPKIESLEWKMDISIQANDLEAPPFQETPMCQSQ